MSGPVLPVVRAIERPAMVAAWRHVDALERAAADAEQEAERLQPAAAAAAVRAHNARTRADRAWGALVVVLRAWAVGQPPSAEALAVLTETSAPQQLLEQRDPRDP